MDRTRSPLRILAPAALVVFGLALVVIVASSGTDDEEGSTDGGSAQSRQDERGGGQGAGSDGGQAAYTVKTGDTLDDISRTTGVSVEEIQQLNPSLDPQALVAGQKIKLRE